ncbi:MAG: hypothetical protein Q7V57_08770 [Actinomycetota bacterium]|nr:hypothetical protein [Actinomycetota bacterium]
MHRQMLAAALTAALVLTACSDDAPTATSGTESADTAPTTALATDTTAGPPADPNALRGVRYCEVLLLRQEATGLVADVWNTMGHSTCPQADWEALDAAAIATERGSLLARLNGPRYWTLDEIDATMQLDAPVTTFGTIEMFLAATVDLGPGTPTQTPYTERGVVRETVFVFHEGSEVYILTDPDGTLYVMQSYSQTLDTTMSADRLPGLGGELQLPAGWTFTVETLSDRLELFSTDGIATVIQDDFQNTYQRVDPTPV